MWQNNLYMCVTDIRGRHSDLAADSVDLVGEVTRKMVWQWLQTQCPRFVATSQVIINVEVVVDNKFNKEICVVADSSRIEQTQLFRLHIHGQCYVQ